MTEEILFESERPRTRTEIAASLRAVANSLEGGSITLIDGEQSVTMEPPERPTFEVKAEREGAADAPGELSVEFEIEWDETDESDDDSGDGLVIE